MHDQSFIRNQMLLLVWMAGAVLPALRVFISATIDDQSKYGETEEIRRNMRELVPVGNSIFWAPFVLSPIIMWNSIWLSSHTLGQKLAL